MSFFKWYADVYLLKTEDGPPLYLKDSKLIFPLVLRVGSGLVYEDVGRDPNWEKLLNFGSFTYMI